MSVTKQPQALQSLDLYHDLHTSGEKHGHGQGGECEGCPSSGAGHRSCHKSRLHRLLFPSMVALLVLGGVMLFSCMGGYEVVWWGAEDLVKRATGTSTSNGGSFTHNKLYLIVIFVGLLVVLILAVMLSAWCCRGSFENPLCCPCYLCACCGGLACLECIGCGLCAEGVDQM